MNPARGAFPTPEQSMTDILRSACDSPKLVHDSRVSL